MAIDKAAAVSPWAMRNVTPARACLIGVAVLTCVVLLSSVLQHNSTRLPQDPSRLSLGSRGLGSNINTQPALQAALAGTGAVAETASQPGAITLRIPAGAMLVIPNGNGGTNTSTSLTPSWLLSADGVTDSSHMAAAAATAPATAAATAAANSSSSTVLIPAAGANNTASSSPFPTAGNSSGTGDSAVKYEEVVPDVSAIKEDLLVDVAKRVLQLDREGKGRRVIAMTLYGNNTRYTYGAIENALMVQRGWPGWTLRFYTGGGVPADILATLRLLGAELVPMELGEKNLMFWRFFVMMDRTVTRYIVRDADSRLTPRDFYAVREWTSTPRLFHIVRDDFFHGLPIMGGIFGGVGGLLHPRLLEPYMKEADNNKYTYGADQTWLAKTVFPLVKNHSLLHASWNCKKYGEAEWRGFPTKRVHDRDFVGNVYWGMNDFQGRTCNGVCPEECRRRPDWTNC